MTSIRAHKAVAQPGFFQQVEEQVAKIGGAQERQPSVATAGNEVQIVSAVITFEAARHGGILRQKNDSCL